MKLAMLGGTRGVGREFVEQALQEGHEITCIARSPERYNLRHRSLRVVKGDALELDGLSERFLGQDAIVSALGVRGTYGENRNFYARAAHGLVSAAQRSGVRRLLCVTSVGVHANPNAPWYYRWIVAPLLSGQYRDMKEMETVIERTQLDWTLVRPTRLTNGGRTGSYRRSLNRDLGPPFAISRADVADFMLETLRGSDYSRRGVDISQ